jgi:hypothetical protein
MTRKTYCGNLLWQSGLTLLARLLRKPVFVKCGQVGAALTAVEVGYDLGVCLYCTTECFSDEE